MGIDKIKVKVRNSKVVKTHCPRHLFGGGLESKKLEREICSRYNDESECIDCWKEFLSKIEIV